MSEIQFEPITLDVDLSSIDTSIPVLPKQLLDMKITSLTKEENKEKKGYNLKVRFETQQELESIQGKPVAPGFPLFKYYPLQKKEGGSDKFDYRQGLAALQDAATGSSMGNRPQFNTGEIINKIVRVAVGIGTAEDGVTPQNEIKSVKFPE